MSDWKIGDVEVTAVTELLAPVPAAGIVPEATAENTAGLSWLRPHYIDADGNLLLNIQALLVESEGRKIVVDTCVGNDKERPMEIMDGLHTDFLERLEALGFGRREVDTVVCTHLHVDHVGWNTMRENDAWVPTFPAARYVIVREEWDFWRESDDDSWGDVIGDSVRPIFDAGLADLVEPGFAVTSELTLEPTPGHTPGHVSVRIRSGGDEAVITGDLMHHPAQVAHPEWASGPDEDKPRARETRRTFIEQQADREILVIGTHFAPPAAGRIRRDGKQHRFEPA